MGDESATDRLCLVWTTGDREAALSMIFMYAGNARRKGWWDAARIIVWGPSARLLAGDPELRDHVSALRAEGVELWACKACADMYGVADDLAGLGIEVLYVGAPFTEMLKSGWTVLSV